MSGAELSGCPVVLGRACPGHLLPETKALIRRKSSRKCFWDAGLSGHLKEKRKPLQSKSWAECRKQTQRRRGRSLPYRPCMVGSACSQPNALRQQHTGQHGWTRRRSSAPASGSPLTAASRSPTWRTAYDGARPPHPTDAGPVDWAARLAASCDANAQSSLSRSRVVAFPATGFPGTFSLARRATRRGLAGSGAQRASTHIGPTSHPARAAATTAFLPLPLCPNRCGPRPGCGQTADAYGDHALACPRTGLLARRAKIVERAWVRVAREAVGLDGQVVPQQRLAHTTALGVPSDDRRRLDLVVYGAAPRGGAMCCDATVVSPSGQGNHRRAPRSGSQSAKTQPGGAAAARRAGFGGRRPPVVVWPWQRVTGTLGAMSPYMRASLGVADRQPPLLGHG